MVLKWNNTSTYSADMMVYGRRTPSFIKNFPEEISPGDVPDWRYREFNISFKKNEHLLASGIVAHNENIDSNNVMDNALALMLEYIPGTQFNYGYLDNKWLYVVFPYVTDSKFLELPIQDNQKATMKLIIISSRTDVYNMDPDNFHDYRGNNLNELMPGNIIERYADLADKSLVSEYSVAMPGTVDYELNNDTGILIYNQPSSNTGTDTNRCRRITFVPYDVKSNKGISKIDLFIDEYSDELVAIHEYESNLLVHVVHFRNIITNPKMDDSLWSNYFKGRKIVPFN